MHSGQRFCSPLVALSFLACERCTLSSPWVEYPGLYIACCLYSWVEFLVVLVSLCSLQPMSEKVGRKCSFLGTLGLGFARTMVRESFVRKMHSENRVAADWEDLRCLCQ